MLHSLPSVVTKRYNTGGIDRRREMVQKKKEARSPVMNLVVSAFGYTRDIFVDLDGYERREWWRWTWRDLVVVVVAVVAFFVVVARRFRERRIRQAWSHMLQAPRQVSLSENR